MGMTRLDFTSNVIEGVELDAALMRVRICIYMRRWWGQARGSGRSIWTGIEILQVLKIDAVTSRLLAGGDVSKAKGAMCSLQLKLEETN